MSELVCVTSGCKEGGVEIETSGARRIAFCAKSCDLCTGASASTSPRWRLLLARDRRAVDDVVVVEHRTFAMGARGSLAG